MGRTRPRKVRNYELVRVGVGSRKLESIDRGVENSYRVMKPHDDDDDDDDVRNNAVFSLKV